MTVAELGSWLGRNAWALINGAMLAGVAVVALYPGRATTDPTDTDVAKAWNDSITRLGIQPVFPPEEDFVVGDVWVSVAGAPQEIPLLGKGVRIAHIDVRKAIQASSVNQPVFDDTVAVAKDGEFRPLNRKEVHAPADDQIALSLAAFPGITITHNARARGGLQTAAGALGAARDDQQFEEIRIPVAETYGISSADAFGFLDDWCKAEATRDFCTDQAARKLLEFVVGPGVVAKLPDGSFACQLQISLVTRVFLTREIQQRSLIGGSRSAGLNAASANEKRPSDAPPPPNPPAVAPASIPTASANAPTASFDRTDRVDTGIRQVFQRPVAFGFRAVNFALSSPPQAQAKK